MLLLSRITGQEVRAAGGRVIGSLADLTVSLGQPSGRHLVERLLIRRHHEAPVLVPWEPVMSFERNHIVIADDGGYSDVRLREHEILLVRDVLDTQVVDVVGQRLARVADVVLTRNAARRIELVGVEVGFGAVLRRLGVESFIARTDRDVIDWADVHLTSERGHAAQLACGRSTVHHLDARGLAALVSRVDTESAAEILAAKGPGAAADVVRAAHPVVGERVLRALPGTDAAQIVAAMPEAHADQWRRRLEHAPALLGRRFLRSRVWPRRRPGRAAW
ncbi:magnesium transporter [Mycolicibacterium sp. P1-5]|uniref:magnesium transporter n=1 Tax=Mycolicibacterium sp. P1-5 TaxID=2024617 RepID=UPI0011F08390|nr:magnesium transporter [Mycolicibacterium sp. P1-5]KAA0111094.1 magnesium transporter [Mycolicibacterium sp. P1-5]